MKKDNRNQSASSLQQRLRSSSKKVKTLTKRNTELEDFVEDVRHLALFFYGVGAPSQQKMAEEFLNLFEDC